MARSQMEMNVMDEDYHRLVSQVAHSIVSATALKQILDDVDQRHHNNNKQLFNALQEPNNLLYNKQLFNALHEPNNLGEETTCPRSTMTNRGCP